MIYAPGEG